MSPPLDFTQGPSAQRKYPAPRAQDKYQSSIMPNMRVRSKSARAQGLRMTLDKPARLHKPTCLLLVQTGIISVWLQIIQIHKTRAFVTLAEHFFRPRKLEKTQSTWMLNSNASAAVRFFQSKTRFWRLHFGTTLRGVMSRQATELSPDPCRNFVRSQVTTP